MSTWYPPPTEKEEEEEEEEEVDLVNTMCGY